MQIKSAPLKVKAVGEEDGLSEGQFLAYASVFGGPPDSYGDLVDPGAFTKTISEWEEKGDPIPLLWGHDMNNPFSNIGHIVKAEEDDHGLKVLGEFDLDNPTAVQVHRLVKGRRTTDLSFAYEIRDSEKAADGLHLKDLSLFEVSIVPIGANRLTDVVAVKALAEAAAQGVKAGRVLSAKNEGLVRDAVKALKDLLSANAGSGDEDQEKASETPVVTPGASDEEPCAVKSPVPAAVQPAGPSVETLAAKYNYDALHMAGQEGVSS